MKPLIGGTATAMLDDFFASQRHACVLLGKQLSVFSSPIIEQFKEQQRDATVLLLAPEDKVITIEQVRMLKRSLSLKQRGQEKRLLLIEHAEALTIEAQNTLLKLLEEPPAGLVFLLLCSHSSGLLPTIRSRAATIPVRPLTRTEAQDFYKRQGVSEDEVTKAYAIADGLPGKLYALLSDESQTYKENIEEAKALLSAQTFTRLARVEELSKDKVHVAALFEAFDDILRAVMHAPSTPAKKIQQYASKRRMLYEATVATQANTNTKLVLTDVFLAL